MATYFSNKVVLDPNTGLNVIPPRYYETGDVVNVAVVTLPVGAQLAVGDTLQLIDVPAGCTYTSFTLDSDKVDSSGSPTLAFNVGDAGNPSRFFGAAAVSQAGGTVYPTAAGSTGTRTTGVTRLLATVTGAQAGAVTGSAKSIRFVIYYAADV